MEAGIRGSDKTLGSLFSVSGAHENQSEIARDERHSLVGRQAQRRRGPHRQRGAERHDKDFEQQGED